MISDRNLRRSRLQLRWEALLSADQIWQWVCLEKKSALPKEPGVYRWIFPAGGSGRSTAYVGQAGVLSERVADYLNEGTRQLCLAKNNGTTEGDLSQEALRQALRDNHRKAHLRIGARLARTCQKCSCENCAIQLERLQIEEEEVILGIEINANLFSDEIGRVFLESLSILQMERQGYTIDNCNRSAMKKELATKLPALKRPTQVRKGPQKKECGGDGCDGRQRKKQSRDESPLAFAHTASPFSLSDVARA